MLGKFVGRSCKGLLVLLVFALLLSYRQEGDTVTPENVLVNTETSSDTIDKNHKVNELKITKAVTSVQSKVKVVVATTPEVSTGKVEFKSYREKLRDKLRQFRLKNVIRTESDGSLWIMSYPGKYLKFPHNFEKV